MGDKGSSERLSDPDIQLAAPHLPLLSDLLTVYDPGCGEIRAPSGDVDGYAQVGAVPPLECRRI
jgi:hypothetical protein